MNPYFLLKLNRKIKSDFVKKTGLFLLHILNRRYIGVFLDPVLGCNLKCRMCHHSDAERRKQKGVFCESDIEKIANAFFHRALKLQIGCQSEPSLFKHNLKIIELGKKYKVPYISMTTNGLLFTEDDWYKFAAAGLDEVTLSMHGTTKSSYEYFMTNASFESFLQTLKNLTVVKNKIPNFKIRLNYTVNKDNLKELGDFFAMFENYKFDILQIRPILCFGNSEYKNFSWEEIYDTYDDTIQKVKDMCVSRGITCLAPNRNDLTKTDNGSSAVFESTRCYIAPRDVYRDDFDLSKDTYNSYAKRTRFAMKLFKNIFRASKPNDYPLNYDVN